MKSATQIAIIAISLRLPASNDRRRASKERGHQNQQGAAQSMQPRKLASNPCRLADSQHSRTSWEPRGRLLFAKRSDEAAFDSRSSRSSSRIAHRFRSYRLGGEGGKGGGRGNDRPRDDGILHRRVTYGLVAADKARPMDSPPICSRTTLFTRRSRRACILL